MPGVLSGHSYRLLMPSIYKLAVGAVSSAPSMPLGLLPEAFSFVPSEIAFESFTASDFQSMNKFCALRTRISLRISGLTAHFERFYSGSVSLGFSYSHVINTLTVLLSRLELNTLIDNKNLEYESVRKAFSQYPDTLTKHIVQLFGQDVRVRLPFDRKVMKARYVLSEAISKSSNPSYIKSCRASLADAEFRHLFLSFLFSSMKASSLLSRKAELQRRILMDAEHFIGNQKWFCIMNTLTVDPENYTKVFSQGSTLWRRYIRNVDSLFARSACGSVRAGASLRRSGGEFHRYFAVTERGGKTGRLHLHVLHFFKSLPQGFADPNLGLRSPRLFEIDALRIYWPFGASCPRAFRFSQCDAYGLLPTPWVWPVDKNNQPFKGGPPVTAMRYVSKYLHKVYDCGTLKDSSILPYAYSWRSKICRKMGTEVCQRFLLLLKPQEMVHLLRHKLLCKIQGRSLPKVLLRRLLCRKLYRMCKSLCPSLLISEMRRFKPRKAFYLQLQNALAQLRLHNPRNFGLLRVTDIRGMDTFELFSDDIQSVFIGGVTHAMA